MYDSESAPTEIIGGGGGGGAYVRRRHKTFIYDRGRSATDRTEVRGANEIRRVLT